MPVTSRKLLVHKVSGAGKKAPNNLRFNPVKRQVVNINCDRKPVIVCCPDNVDYDAGNAVTNYNEVLEDDGTGLGIDAGNAQTESCS